MPTIETMTERYNTDPRLQALMSLREFIRAAYRNIMDGRVNY